MKDALIWRRLGILEKKIILDGAVVADKEETIACSLLELMVWERGGLPSPPFPSW